MKEILNKNDQFLKLSIHKEKYYNFFINLEKKICEPLKVLYQLNIIDKKTYDKRCHVGSYFGIQYGLAKVHKQLINNCPPFRPILSAIGAPTYNIAKFLVPILKPLITNDYTLKDTFEFSHEILNQNPNLLMASLDVDSLFTNIPLDETINIIIKKLFSENGTVHNLNKDQFKCLLTQQLKILTFFLMGNYTNKLTVLLWDLPLVQHQLIFLFAIVRIFGYVTVPQNANLAITNVMWTIFLFFLSRKPKLSRSKIS